MSLRTSLLAILFALPMFAFACAEIPGTYKVVGVDPVSGPYTATLVIQKEGSVFTAHWKFSETSSDEATGVRRGDCLSFVFNENGSSSFGTQLYKIKDETLQGPWVRFGATSKGVETAFRVGEDESISSHSDE